MRRGKLAAGALLAGVAALAVAAQFTRANRFRPGLAAALERSLGRKVELGDVYYQAFPAPGLAAQNVVIPDDPAYGLEPIAYVTQLAVTPRWSALLLGRLELGAVRMQEASVNIAHTDETGWNFARLLEAMRASARRAAPPHLVLRGGRINFRRGAWKSPYYLNDVDLEFTPTATTDSPFEWQYEASPARTDRAEQGFGRFIGQGRWQPAGGVLDVALELERSAANEVATLAAGRDLGLPGRIASRARLFGPPQALRITGAADCEGMERAGLFGLRSASLRVAYEGSLDLSAQRFRWRTVRNEKDPLPVDIEVGAENLFQRATWRAALTLDDAPAAALADFARRFGWRELAEMKVDGRLKGSLRLAEDGTLAGELSGRELKLAGGYGLAEADLEIEGGAVRLAPARLTAPNGTEAEVSGAWTPAAGALELRLATRELAVKDLAALARLLPDAPAVPLLSAESGGRLAGVLTLERTAAETGWSGDFDLVGAVLRVDGVAEPVQLKRAAVRLRRERFQLRKLAATAGATAFTGEVDYDPAAARRVHFRLAAEEGSLDGVQALLRPLLERRPGLLERTLRRAAALPEWLRARRAEGELYFGSFAMSGWTLRDVVARIYWDGAAIDLPLTSARWGEAAWSGRLNVRLDGERPRYRLLGRLEGVEWQGGELDAEIDLRAAGYGAELLASRRVDGQAQARRLRIGEESGVELNACYEAAAAGGGWRLTLRCLDGQAGGEVLAGHATAQGEGRWLLELAGEKRTLRATLDAAGFALR